MEIILATFNENKAREIAAIMAPVRVKSLAEFGVEIDFDAVEDADTYEENAFKKARAAAEHVEGIIVADDSGLEVDALGGGPGVHSARYAGEGASGEALYTKLLGELEGTPREKRGARFVCMVAVRYPDGAEESIEGECRGEIADAPRGGGGFGYDPVFLLPGRGRTMAEITASEKNELSHRAAAFRALKKMLLDRDII